MSDELREIAQFLEPHYRGATGHDMDLGTVMQYLIDWSAEIDTLEGRVDELEAENIELRKSYGELQRQHRELAALLTKLKGMP